MNTIGPEDATPEPHPVGRDTATRIESAVAAGVETGVRRATGKQPRMVMDRRTYPPWAATLLGVVATLITGVVAKACLTWVEPPYPSKGEFTEASKADKLDHIAIRRETGDLVTGAVNKLNERIDAGNATVIRAIADMNTKKGKTK